MKKLFLFVIVILMLLPVMSYAISNGNIAGKVVDEDGKAVEAVSIIILQLEKGAYSGANGSFYLKDVDAGSYDVQAQLLGYSIEKKSIDVKMGETTMIRFVLKSKAVEMEGFVVSANRAVKRETPVAFTNISNEAIKAKYTTGDMPDMLDDIPGLFSTTSGMGEAEITMRGFDANKIQILINGIPVNDPESQVVYWSNWTGLASNIKSVQVQRGAGASLYGSGAFGGSVNIETMGSGSDQEFSIRSSGGFYTTDGKSATHLGVMEDYFPYNYNLQLKYSSGKLFDNKFKYDISAERKAGDYYIRGTEYDGWSFGIEAENQLSSHVINTSFIVAPQKHNQARSTYDRELGNFLGREFNITNHEWQENKYNKPQFSIRDHWVISPKTNMMTNFFVTTGEGGGSYANNIIFDAETGELLYKPLTTETAERRNFAKYAYHVYEETGVAIDGFVYDEDTTAGTFTWADDSKTVYSGSNFFSGDPNHTWKMTSYNNHQQFGLNSYLDRDLTDNINIILGTEGRYWQADHYKEGTDFRYYDPTDPDSVSTFGAFMTDYDYSSSVLNTSAFLRTKVKIPVDSFVQDIHLMFDGQYALYYSAVDENMIRYFDINNNEFIDEGFYATKNDSVLAWQYDADGDSTQVMVARYDDDDYNRTFDFFSPKVGVNVNINDNWNILSNYSIVYKEPKVSDWYDRGEGPGVNQIVNNQHFELKPEKGETMEFGLGFKSKLLTTDVTYYHTKFSDKIEKVTDIHGDPHTINAGEATHQGIEVGMGGKFSSFDYNGSLTLSKNRWDELNLENIFYEKAEDVEGKVVPFSPEQMASGGIGYTFQDMPLMGTIRVGLSAKWSDEYYTTYDNVFCEQQYFYDEDGNFQSIGEHEFVENSAGAGHYNYNEDTDSYSISYSNTGDFDREWIMQSSKLPAFFELNSSISYKFYIGSHETSLKLNINNMLNKTDNYSKAKITKAYGMQTKVVDENGDIVWSDPTFGEAAVDGNATGSGYYPYLSPSPLLNVFLTVEIKF